MGIGQDLQKRYGALPKKSPHLHSPAHLLADELSTKLREPKRFGMYLKLALSNDHAVLRRVLGSVLESNAKNPGALFAFLVKQEKNKPNDITNS